MPTLSESAQRIPAGVFAQLQRRIDALAAKGGDLVPLHIGDTCIAPPDAARFERVIAAAPDDALYRYGATAGLADLRDAVAERARERWGIAGVEGGKNVHLGVGGTQALFCAARAVLDPGDDVLVAAPYWPLSVGVFAACSARSVEVPLTSRLYADPTLDAAAPFEAAMTPRTKALYLITPNNPDGKVLGRAELGRLARFAIDNDLWVFSDEVYAEITFEGREHVSIASLEGMGDRTIVVQSFSKSHALAGARVGAVVAPEPVVVAARRVGVHSAFNVPVAMQRSALAALRAGDDWMRAARDSYRVARDASVDALRGAPVAFSVAEGATYLFLDLAPVLGDRPLSVALERAVDHGVLLAPGDAFGRAYGTHARLCFTSAPLPRVLDGIARLRAALESLPKG